MGGRLSVYMVRIFALAIPLGVKVGIKNHVASYRFGNRIEDLGMLDAQPHIVTTYGIIKTAAYSNVASLGCWSCGLIWGTFRHPARGWPLGDLKLPWTAIVSRLAYLRCLCTDFLADIDEKLYWHASLVVVWVPSTRTSALACLGGHRGTVRRIEQFRGPILQVQHEYFPAWHAYH